MKNPPCPAQGGAEPICRGRGEATFYSRTVERGGHAPLGVRQPNGNGSGPHGGTRSLITRETRDDN